MFSGSALRFRDLDRIIFGRDLELADSFYDDRFMYELDVPSRDLRATELLMQALRKAKPATPNLYVTFYESTHHDYYWPRSRPAYFTPYADHWNYSEIQLTGDEILRIRNRYRNAVYFVDSLIGELIAELKRVGRYENSVIIVTGDHGEEFFEYGHLTHANDLNRAQTEVPILLKFPQKTGVDLDTFKDRAIVSHLELLPTVLDYVGTSGDTSKIFDGSSMFRQHCAFALVAAGNGGSDPYSFYLDDGEQQAFFAYPDTNRRIFLQEKIQLVKISDRLNKVTSANTQSKEISKLVNLRFRKPLECVYGWVSD